MSEVPDHAPIFDGGARLDYGKFCVHASHRVNETQRTVKCAECGAALDPFQVVLQYARKDRVRDDMRAQVAELRGKLVELYKEEKRIKARVRNAKRKDADAAVSAAIAKAQEGFDSAVWRLHAARSELRTAIIQLGGECDA